MNRHQLATILSWAGDQGFSGRKRLQKVVFFLQKAGCDLGCQYTLHHFGPYSRDVADACDEMVAAGLITETGGQQGGSIQYSYTINPKIRDLVGRTPCPQLQQFQELGAELIKKEIWPLELGSTILYFYGQTSDWDRALEQACAFKKVPSDCTASGGALALARSVQEKAVA